MGVSAGGFLKSAGPFCVAVQPPALAWGRSSGDVLQPPTTLPRIFSFCVCVTAFQIKAVRKDRLSREKLVKITSKLGKKL